MPLEATTGTRWFRYRNQVARMRPTELPERLTFSRWRRVNDAAQFLREAVEISEAQAIAAIGLPKMNEATTPRRWS